MTITTDNPTTAPAWLNLASLGLTEADIATAATIVERLESTIRDLAVLVVDCRTVVDRLELTGSGLPDDVREAIDDATGRNAIHDAGEAIGAMFEYAIGEPSNGLTDHLRARYGLNF